VSVIGVGIDIAEVARVREVMTRHGDRFLERTLTAKEREDVERKSTRAQGRAEHVAARFACKEAVLKALGTGLTHGITWQEIEIAVTPSGAPQLHLSGRALRRAKQVGIDSWHVSLTHTHTAAAAVAVGCGASSTKGTVRKRAKPKGNVSKPKPTGR
jgi:holo-[acyl-carrier protein] synthase